MRADRAGFVTVGRPRVRSRARTVARVLAVARTFAILGIDAREVRVEMTCAPACPRSRWLDCPTRPCASRAKRSALPCNSGFEFPQKRITANLAPADLRKAGPGVTSRSRLRSSRRPSSCPTAPSPTSRSPASSPSTARSGPCRGRWRWPRRRAGPEPRAIVVPAACRPEAALGAGCQVVPISRLERLRQLGGDGEPPEPAPLRPELNGAAPVPRSGRPPRTAGPARPRGRRGRRPHNLLIGGPPGAEVDGGAAAAVDPPALGPEEAIEAARVASTCGWSVPSLRPTMEAFRAPHHTVSTAGLIGGGNPPRPGEVTLAHHGVLFLDELPEFGRDTLEALRQPLKADAVRLVRARYSIELPCRFQFVAAANPCPCGTGPRSGQCTCDPASRPGV